MTDNSEKLIVIIFKLKETDRLQLTKFPLALTVGMRAKKKRFDIIEAVRNRSNTSCYDLDFTELGFQGFSSAFNTLSEHNC
jgi:hypothetical protein